MVKVLTRQNENLRQQVEQKNFQITQLKKRAFTVEDPESITSSESDLYKLTTKFMKTDTTVQTSISLPSSKLWGNKL